MLLPRKPRRPRGESVVPMINVVFLLLIFFLMTARIAPPEPFEVILPVADRDDAAGGTVTLHLSAEGTVAFGAARGDAAVALAAEAAEAADRAGLMLRADAGADGAAVARLLRRLAEAGVGEVTLLTAGPR